jgi:hypothetical protein
VTSRLGTGKPLTFFYSVPSSKDSEILLSDLVGYDSPLQIVIRLEGGHVLPQDVEDLEKWLVTDVCSV